MAKHDDDDALRDNPLADQLRDLDVSPADPPPKSASSSHPGSDNPPDLSDDQLFERAMADLDDDDIPDPDQWANQTSATIGDHHRQSRPPSSAETSSPNTEDAPSTDEPSDDKAATSSPPSDRELFEQAVDTIDPARLYAAKFKGEAATDLPDTPDVPAAPSNAQPPPSSSKVEEAEARADNQHLQDKRRFEQMLGSVKPLDDDGKYHRQQPRRRRPDPSNSTPSHRLYTPSLPKSGEGLHYVPPLDATQQRLRDRQRRDGQALPDLHIRGDRRDEALQRLEAFIDEHRANGVRFIRIVHGRGLRSQSAPVLKPSVLRWLEGPGLTSIEGYIPERTQSGDYGSLIVELTPIND